MFVTNTKCSGISENIYGLFLMCIQRKSSVRGIQKNVSYQQENVKFYGSFPEFGKNNYAFLKFYVKCKKCPHLLRKCLIPLKNVHDTLNIIRMFQKFVHKNNVNQYSRSLKSVYWQYKDVQPAFEKCYHVFKNCSNHAF